MNRYPLWKNATVLIAVVLGLLYTLPNFFGEAPAVQVASVKSTHKIDAKLMAQVAEALKTASVVPQGVVLDLARAIEVNAVNFLLHLDTSVLHAQGILSGFGFIHIVQLF